MTKQENRGEKDLVELLTNKCSVCGDITDGRDVVCGLCPACRSAQRKAEEARKRVARAKAFGTW